MLLTTFFAIGVVLVSRESGYTADLTSFLFGRILTVTGQQLSETLVVTLLVVAALVLLRRPLIARTCDPQGAQAAGYRIGALDLATNAIVALVVASVRAVGTVLVIALLIVPAAAARAVSDRDRLAIIIPLLVP